ncbi:MAG: hypothetical protein ABI947_17770 [Chloroflexota bacterium]
MMANSVEHNDRRDVRTLSHSVFDMVRCHLVIFMAFWMAIFAPVMCEYHGVMLHFGHADDPTQFHLSMHHEHSNEYSNPVPELPQSLVPGLKVHEMASSVTMLMSLFVVAMPNPITTAEFAKPSNIFSVDANLPRQRLIAPPDQPPRSL